MPRVAYVNGQYVNYRAASVSIDDRGFQFGDSVYEVVAVREGSFIEIVDHLDRLERSLSELHMSSPVRRDALLIIINQIRMRNRVRDGLVYLQVSRGVALRSHGFPTEIVRPSLIVTGRPRTDQQAAQLGRDGICVITVPDDRWRRRDIKSTNLLPNVLAKQRAIEAGCREAWLVDDRGFVTEGSSSTAWIVTSDKSVVTRPLSKEILPGVTRRNLVETIRKSGALLKERPFSVTEAESAAEAFITSANNPVTPVVQINAAKIGVGKPGPITKMLQQKYRVASSGHNR